MITYLCLGFQSSYYKQFAYIPVIRNFIAKQHLEFPSKLVVSQACINFLQIFPHIMTVADKLKYSLVCWEFEIGSWFLNF